VLQNCVLFKPRTFISWGITLQAVKSDVRIPIFFILPNPSSRTMVLELTQPLTEMSTKNCLGGGG
jgi:hypothetical protein